MATSFKTPGVYVVEKSIFPPSVAEVETAIPGFIGYTEKAMEYKSGDLQFVCKKITSLKEYEKFFGYGPPTSVSSVTIDNTNNVTETVFDQIHYLYDSLKLFFNNGGGKCYIISVGYYSDPMSKPSFEKGIDVLKKKDEPTLILFPDAVSLVPSTGIYDLQKRALAQAGELMDRFVIMDLLNKLNPNIPDDTTNFDLSNDEFRNNIGMTDLKFGAAYAPWVKANIVKDFTYPDIRDVLKQNSAAIDINPDLTGTLPAADQTTINNILTDYDQLITCAGNIDAAFFTQYGSFSYNLKQSYSDLLSTFKTMVTDPTETMANIRAAYMALHDEAFMMADHLDDLLDNPVPPSVLVNPALFTKCDTIATGVADELLNLVVLNNTLNNFALHEDPVSGDYPRQDNIANVQFLDTTGTWANVDMEASLHDLTDDEALFIHSEAVIAAEADPLIQDQMRRENMLGTEAIITDAFFAFYNAYSAMLSELSDMMLEREAELIKSYPVYKNIINAVNNTPTLMPPSGAVAGRYAYVDGTRGVWKAPANIDLAYVSDVAYHTDDKEQEGLNVDSNSGKSINIIRTFTGKGVLIWGSRTLAGNDNEWRYVPVRRFFNMVEESVKKSTFWAVFEPNDANTWSKVKGMIDNFLTLQWRNGALQGAKPDEAFYVKVGLGQTMSAQDILEGRMNVEIGMAVVRPAEFIILTFSHKMVTSS
jgi:phage tail sheath protein FI